MTPPPNVLLTAFWFGIFSGFVYLWVAMLLNWWFGHRDNRALVYVLLLMQLSVIAGINAVIRFGIFGLDPYTLVAIQRGIWFAALVTSFGVVDIYHAAHRHTQPKAMDLADKLTHMMGIVSARSRI